MEDSLSPFEGSLSPADSTIALLARVKAGDASALEILIGRYRPRLVRWAHRRLPIWARDLAETDDLVHDTLIKTLRNLKQFTAETDSGLHNYLRLAIGNAVRDEIRRAMNRPGITSLDPSHPSDAPSPLEQAVGRSRLERYEAALRRLSPIEREAIVGRLEFGLTHAELADALGKTTPDAARKLCQRALTRLLTLMTATPRDTRS